jgi:beta-xylosidase
MLSDALPRLPAWASQEFGWAWAPEVTVPASGKGYIMYFVAHYVIDRGGTQCIGVATSDKPEGPFVSSAEKPIICQVDRGGSIDPSTFVDEGGQHYILWKNDGNSVHGQTWLFIQSLSEDGLSLTGKPAQLITADKAWEGILVEAPTLWKHAGKYYLFYSANAYNNPSYATGYAVADKILGPYVKPDKPLLKTSIKAHIVGPGGQDIVTGPKGGDWIVYHGWTGTSYRRLYLSPLEWENGVPVVNLEDTHPMPLP